MKSEQTRPPSMGLWAKVSPYVEVLILIALLAYTRHLAAGTLGDRARYTLFFVAPCYGVWRGGLGPGLMSLAVTCYLGTFFFLPPPRSQAFAALGDVVNMLLYIGVGLVIVFFGEAQRAEHRRVLARDQELQEAYAKLAEANTALEAAVQKRTEQLQELRQWAADEM